LIFSQSILADTSNKPSKLKTPPTPCIKDVHYQDFDFWLGDWDVYDGKGNLVGKNLIEKKFTNCLITESWQSSSNTPGFSMNYYNPVTKKWTQKWVSNGAVIEYSGNIVDGSMILEGTL